MKLIPFDFQVSTECNKNIVLFWNIVHSMQLHFWRQIMQTIRFLPEWCWRTCHHRMMRNWKSELRERLTQFRHWENSIRSNDFHSFDIKLNYFVFHDFKLCDLAWHVERCRNKPRSSGTLHWIADSAMRKACEKGRKTNKQTNCSGKLHWIARWGVSRCIAHSAICKAWE